MNEYLKICLNQRLEVLTTKSYPLYFQLNFFVFLCFLLSVGCISSELTSIEQEQVDKPTPSPTTQPLTTEGPTLTPTPLFIPTQPIRPTAPIQTPIQPVTSVTPTQFPATLDIDLQAYAAHQGLLLYTKPEQGNFPLISWPEMPFLNQSLFKAIYGEQIGYLYANDFAPDLNTTGRYLIVPGVNSGTDAALSHTTTWLVDLDTEEIQQMENNPQSAIWSPDGENLAYIVNETLYVKSVGEGGKTVEIFAKAGLNEFFLAWSPDTKQIAVITTTIDENGGDAPLITQTLLVINLENKMQQELGTFSIVPMAHLRKALQWSPDGSAILVGMTMPNYIFSLSGPEIALEEGIRAWNWMQHQSNILVQQGSNLSIFDPINHEIVTNIAHLERPLTTWTFSANGRYLAYPNQREIHIFDLELQKEHTTVIVPFMPVASLHWIPGDYDVLVIDDGDWNTPIWVVDLNNQVEVLVEKGLLINFIP